MNRSSPSALPEQPAPPELRQICHLCFHCADSIRPHRTYLKRGSKEELQAYGRVADELGVTREHVREVHRGGGVSKKVSAVWEAEGLSLPPVAHTYLEKKRIREKYAQIADEFGVSVSHVRNVAHGFGKSEANRCCP